MALNIDVKYLKSKLILKLEWLHNAKKNTNVQLTTTHPISLRVTLSEAIFKEVRNKSIIMKYHQKNLHNILIFKNTQID